MFASMINAIFFAVFGVNAAIRYYGVEIDIAERIYREMEV